MRKGMAKIQAFYKEKDGPKKVEETKDEEKETPQKVTRKDARDYMANSRLSNSFGKSVYF